MAGRIPIELDLTRPGDPAPMKFRDLPCGALFSFTHSPGVVRCKLEDNEYLFFAGDQIYAMRTSDGEFQDDTVVQIPGRLRLTITHP